MREEMAALRQHASPAPVFSTLQPLCHAAATVATIAMRTRNGGGTDTH